MLNKNELLCFVLVNYYYYLCALLQKYKFNVQKYIIMVISMLSYARFP